MKLAGVHFAMAITANRVMVLVLGSQKGIIAAQWAKSNLLGAATDNVILVRATKISGSILSAGKLARLAEVLRMHHQVAY